MWHDMIRLRAWTLHFWNFLDNEIYFGIRWVIKVFKSWCKVYMWSLELWNEIHRDFNESFPADLSTFSVPKFVSDRKCWSMSNYPWCHMLIQRSGTFISLMWSEDSVRYGGDFSNLLAFNLYLLRRNERNCNCNFRLSEFSLLDHQTAMTNLLRLMFLF